MCITQPKVEIYVLYMWCYFCLSAGTEQCFPMPMAQEDYMFLQTVFLWHIRGASNVSLKPHTHTSISIESVRIDRISRRLILDMFDICRAIPSVKRNQLTIAASKSAKWVWGFYLHLRPNFSPIFTFFWRYRFGHDSQIKYFISYGTIFRIQGKTFLCSQYPSYNDQYNVFNFFSVFFIFVFILIALHFPEKSNPGLTQRL